MPAGPGGAPVDLGATGAWQSGRVAAHATTHRQRCRRPVLGRGARRRSSEAIPSLDALRKVRTTLAVRRWALRVEGESPSAREDALRSQKLHRIAWRPETARRRRGTGTLSPRVSRGPPRRLSVALVRSRRAERLQGHFALLREWSITPDRKPVGALRHMRRGQEHGAGLRTGGQRQPAGLPWGAPPPKSLRRWLPGGLARYSLGCDERLVPSDAFGTRDPTGGEPTRAARRRRLDVLRGRGERYRSNGRCEDAEEDSAVAGHRGIHRRSGLASD